MYRYTETGPERAGRREKPSARTGEIVMEFLNAYTFGFCERRGFTSREDWKDSFGMNFAEHEASQKIDLMQGYVTAAVTEDAPIVTAEIK